MSGYGYPDLWYDMITPEEGGIRLAVDQRFLMRCLARFKSVYGIYPRGWGKCISGDSLLFTEEGIKEIGEYFDYAETNEEFYTSHNINLLNRDGQLKTSNKGVYSGYKPTKKITTEEGYEIEGTLVHPLLVMTKEGDLEWKQAKDIEVGDYVPINRKNDIWGNKTKLDIDMETWLNSFGGDSRWKIERVKSNIINELDEELALIMGYLVGDGCMTRHNNILFSNIDEDVLLKYISFMEGRLGVEVKKKNDIDYLIDGMYIREYFNQLGLKQVNAFNKEIPKTILEAPKNIVASFLKGLFDTDGTVDDKRVSLCTVSEKMSKQIQVVLLNFGIVSTRRIKYNKKFDTNAYLVDIYGRDTDVFYQEIGFGCSRKQEKLSKIIDKKRNTNKDMIPYQKDSVLDFYNEVKKTNKGIYDKVYHIIKGNNNLTYDKLEMLLDLNEANSCKNYEQLLKLYELNYFYSRVKTVEDGENHVYDLQVPDTNSFISNGFISHNTMIELMANYHACIFYPDIEITMTAQTKENASNLIGEKWREVSKFYPMINDELQHEPSISKDKAVVPFKSGGKHQ